MHAQDVSIFSHKFGFYKLKQHGLIFQFFFTPLYNDPYAEKKGVAELFQIDCA